MLTYASTQNWDRRVRQFLLSRAEFDLLPDETPSDLAFRMKVSDHQMRKVERSTWRTSR